MVIEKNEKEIVLRVSAAIESQDFQRILEYLRYLEATAESNADAALVDQIANESKAAWWAEHQSKQFVGIR